VDLFFEKIFSKGFRKFSSKRYVGFWLFMTNKSEETNLGHMFYEKMYVFDSGRNDDFLYFGLYFGTWPASVILYLVVKLGSFGVQKSETRRKF